MKGKTTRVCSFCGLVLEWNDTAQVIHTICDRCTEAMIVEEEEENDKPPLESENGSDP